MLTPTSPPTKHATVPSAVLGTDSSSTILNNRLVLRYSRNPSIAAQTRTFQSMMRRCCDSLRSTLRAVRQNAVVLSKMRLLLTIAPPGSTESYNSSAQGPRIAVANQHPRGPILFPVKGQLNEVA